MNFMFFLSQQVKAVLFIRFYRKLILLLFPFFPFLVQAQISGRVYVDFDANGVQTLSQPYEPGMPAVKVRVFVDTNPTPSITQTGPDGFFSFSAQQAPPGSRVRVEFYELPFSFSPGLTGRQSHSEVQFATAPSSQIYLGIFNDDEYCMVGSELKIVTSCYTMGDPLKNGSTAQTDALVMFDYLADGVNPGQIQHLAYTKEIGATWISAYQRTSNLLLVGAITRRHVGLGPLGTGGFYTVDLKSGGVKPFLDVKTIGIDTGPDPHIDPVSQLNLLPAEKNAKSRDSIAFHRAGKTGIGAAQLSTYQDTLFFVNLYDKKLYRFAIGKPFIAPTSTAQAQVKSYTIPHPSCSNQDFAPWALKYYRGRFYVGVVCTAEQSRDPKDLKATVYEFNPLTEEFRSKIEFGLDYPRGPIDQTSGCDTINRWYPWTNVFPKQCNYPAGAPDPLSAFAIHPQAILSDIEFDDDGSMFLGFMDRLGLQTGQDQPGIALDDTLNYYGFMSGDLLRAQRNADGSFSLEQNARSGNRVGCGVDNQAGPGNGEFFCEDYWLNGAGSVGHQEITNGGLLKIPGTAEILSSAMDPVHGVYLSTGFIAFDTYLGKRKRSFSIYSVQEGVLGKSGGVGDLTGICAPAPLEIGNVLWLDSNKNGIQDPLETRLDGVVIRLHDMEDGGKEVAHTTTREGGQYYFNDANVVGGLQRHHAYEIRIGLEQVGLTNLTATIRLTDDSEKNGLRDSDAIENKASNELVISVVTGDSSQNNHALDAGVVTRGLECPPGLCLPVTVLKKRL
jgi:hypothetical protein